MSDLLPRLRGDSELGHFWQHRAEDSLKRSKQHLIDLLCSGAGGPVYYSGREWDSSPGPHFRHGRGPAASTDARAGCRR